VIGTPGRTRTCDPRLRRPLLYPTELRAQYFIINQLSRAYRSLRSKPRTARSPLGGGPKRGEKTVTDNPRKTSSFPRVKIGVSSCLLELSHAGLRLPPLAAACRGRRIKTRADRIPYRSQVFGYGALSSRLPAHGSDVVKPGRCESRCPWR
jgi:hypothetical protein